MRSLWETVKTIDIWNQVRYNNSITVNKKETDMTFQLTDIKEDRVTKELVQQIEDYVDRMIDQGFDGQDVLDELETMGFTTIVKFLEIEWDMVYDETEWE